MNIYNLLKKRLIEISQKQVDFAFLDEFDGITNFLQGRFFFMAKNLQVETISLNHKKSKRRSINLNYIKTNNLINNNSIEDILEVESIIDKLVQDEELKKYILNIDYSLDINIEKNDTRDSIGVLNIEINLEIKER